MRSEVNHRCIINTDDLNGSDMKVSGTLSYHSHLSRNHSSTEMQTCFTIKVYVLGVPIEPYTFHHLEILFRSLLSNSYNFSQSKRISEHCFISRITLILLHQANDPANKEIARIDFNWSDLCQLERYVLSDQLEALPGIRLSINHSNGFTSPKIDSRWILLPINPRLSLIEPISWFRQSAHTSRDVWCQIVLLCGTWMCGRLFVQIMSRLRFTPCIFFILACLQLMISGQCCSHTSANIPR